MSRFCWAKCLKQSFIIHTVELNGIVSLRFDRRCIVRSFTAIVPYLCPFSRHCTWIIECVFHLSFLFFFFFSRLFSSCVFVCVRLLMHSKSLSNKFALNSFALNLLWIVRRSTNFTVVGDRARATSCCRNIDRGSVTKRAEQKTMGKGKGGSGAGGNPNHAQPEVR